MDARRASDYNKWVHRYLIALTHATLWIAALCLAGFAHLSPWFSAHEALLISTLVAYCAYLCESGLGTWRVAAASSDMLINFRRAALWRWICLNVIVGASLSVIFLLSKSWIWIVAVILAAGWQKYMDGRIPPRLQSTMIPLSGNEYKSLCLSE